MKKAVILGLLICLVTLNLPKNFFHSHEHQEDHVENNWDLSVSADDSDCFACDVDLINITTIHHSTIQIDSKAIVHGKEFVYFSETSNHVQLQKLRGPPAFI